MAEIVTTPPAPPPPADDGYEPPNLIKFVTETPLYTEIALRLQARGPHENEVGNPLPARMPVLAYLLYPPFPIDAYCPGCKQHSIFRATNLADADQKKVIAVLSGASYHHILLRCSRIALHELVVSVRLDVQASYQYSPVPGHARRVKVTKIGMWPALADLQEPLKGSAAKALGSKGLAEFKRAVGLAAHGIWRSAVFGFDFRS